MIKRNLMFLATVATLFMGSQTAFAECAAQGLECSEGSHNFSYVKMGFGGISLHDSPQTMPALSFGRRYFSGDSGVDISFGYGYSDRGKNHIRMFTLPRIMYLGYSQPENSSSPYLGGGVSFSGIESVQLVHDERVKNEFYGISLELTLGYEMKRDTNYRIFGEVSVSQPVIAAYEKGDRPGPVVMFFLGVGG